MNNYYVYGLIDPRTNQIFYIGKGKGKRYQQHLSEKEGLTSNTEKLRIINEVKNEKKEIGISLIGENLSEEEALLLEKILIHRIGRQIFDEGVLTNITPGGKWHKNKSLFIGKNEIPDSNYIQKHFANLIPILDKYPHVAKPFGGLECPHNPQDHYLYVCDKHGKQIHKWNIDEFVKIFGLGHAMDLVSNIKLIDRPLYAWNRVWSKSVLEKEFDCSRIPFQEFDVLDLHFLEEFNKKIKDDKNFELSAYGDNKTIQAIVRYEFEPETIMLEHYYTNGNIKHRTFTKQLKHQGTCTKWFKNGNYQKITEYDQGKKVVKKTFYPTGALKRMEEYNSEGLDPATTEWYENGQIQFQKLEDGSTFAYSEDGNVMSKGVNVGDVENGGYFLHSEYFENGNLKNETKTYYENDLLHGYEKSFYGTGELRREVDYTKGIDNKLIKTYKKNGEVTVKSNRQ